MNWYWVFYFLTIIENLTIAMLAIWVISLIAIIAFTMVWFINKHEIVEGYERHKEGYELWEKLSRRALKIFIPIFIIFFTLNMFTPSRNGIMLIIAGGSIGEFITSNEDIKGLPADMTHWFKLQIQDEIQELKNFPIKAEIQKLTKEQLQEELLKLKIEEKIE